MKEIKSIVDAYRSLDLSATGAVLATVARVEGSSYRRTGARMLVLEDGTYLGGISGGCLEGDALRRAQKAIVQNKPSLTTYDTTQEDSHQIGVGLGCNGIIDVLFSPLGPMNEQNPVELLSSLINTRHPRALAWITDCNEPLESLGTALLYENDEQFLQHFTVPVIAHQLLSDLKAAMENLAPQTITYQNASTRIKIFIEIILPVTRVIIHGGNYDVHSMIRTTRELGWDVTLVTNIMKADKSLFALANRVMHNKGTEQPEADYYTAVLLMSHDYHTDFDNLQKALKTNASYIGLLGPRKRSDKMFDALLNKGFALPPQELQRIFAPAGLDIGAATPEEIALSIAAEIRCHFTGRKGMSLRLREGSIYGN
jgi:xanthine dehydrogenase accessory factor